MVLNPRPSDLMTKLLSTLPHMNCWQYHPFFRLHYLERLALVPKLSRLQTCALGSNTDFKFGSSKNDTVSHLLANLLVEMAEISDKCVNEEQFYAKLDSLKASRKGQASNLTVFVNDDFYDRSKAWLTAVHSNEGLSAKDVVTIKRKKWTLQHGRIASKDGKYVVPKRDLFKTLSEAHSAIAHRGRDKTEHYIRESYAEISQEVITLFVSLCKLHQQQRSVTDHVKKPVIKPLAADGFLKHVEIDLIDFRNLPCSCNPKHNWVLHVVDHFSKFSWLHPLQSKETEQVVKSLQEQFYLFGFPTILHSDNGKEFQSHKMNEFCSRNKIKQVYGAPRTPTTQGLVERNHRTIKENMTNIIKEKNEKKENWCKILNEAAYKKNVVTHSATGRTPYEAVFGFLAIKEVHNVEATDKDSANNEEDPATPVQDSPVQRKRKDEEQDMERKKLKTDINEKQSSYNSRMKESRKKAPTFHKDDFVSIKIDKVDKTSPLHPNVLLGKITHVENDYAKIVTKFGKVKTFISANRLNKCTATNIKFDYSKDITFSAACKMATEQ